MPRSHGYLPHNLQPVSVCCRLASPHQSALIIRVGDGVTARSCLHSNLCHLDTPTSSALTPHLCLVCQQPASRQGTAPTASCNYVERQTSPDVLEPYRGDC